MSEKEQKQKFSERHPKLTNELFAAGTLSALLAIGVGGSALANAADGWDPFDQKEEIREAMDRAFVDKITDATNGMYSPDDVVGQFTLENNDLNTAAFDTVHKSLGDETYYNVEALINNVLNASVGIQMEQKEPEAGDTYVIVEKDINPEVMNGNEYVVVTPSQIK